MNGIFISCALLFAVAAGAQTRPAAGYVVPDNGDTLRGQVEVRGFNTAPEQIYFTRDGGGRQQYSVENCRAFGVGDEVYERWTVKMDMSCMSTMDFKVIFEDSILTTTVFLKRVYKGKHLGLYKYYRGNEAGLLKVDREKMHFFLADDENMQELVISYKEPNKDANTNLEAYKYRQDWTARQTRRFYRDQLRTYFDWSTDKKLKQLIDELQYDEASMVKAIIAVDAKMR